MSTLSKSNKLKALAIVLRKFWSNGVVESSVTKTEFLLRGLDSSPSDSGESAIRLFAALPVVRDCIKVRTTAGYDTYGFYVPQIDIHGRVTFDEDGVGRVTLDPNE